MIRWKQKKHTEPHEQRGKEEDMNEQEARELLEDLTREELISLCDWLEARQRSRELGQSLPE